MAKLISFAIQKFKEHVSKIKVFFTGVYEWVVIIRDFDNKEFEKQENFCHGLKPKNDKQYYFFLWSCIVVWSLSLVVFSWDYIIIKNPKFFIKYYGSLETYETMIFITNNQMFLRTFKSVMMSTSLGFMLVLQLYQMMSYVIVFNKMLPYIRNTSDKKEQFNFLLIVIYYLIVIFIVNIMIYLFFVSMAYKHSFFNP